jgi:putative RNA 2'-phosphotransferase
MQGHLVHLSAEVDTATRVGARRGRAVVFEVDAGAMRSEGCQFFRSANGVWLVDAVPARFLRLRP